MKNVVVEIKSHDFYCITHKTIGVVKKKLVSFIEMNLLLSQAGEKISVITGGRLQWKIKQLHIFLECFELFYPIFLTLTLIVK